MIKITDAHFLSHFLRVYFFKVLSQIEVFCCFQSEFITVKMKGLLDMLSFLKVYLCMYYKLGSFAFSLLLFI